MTPDVAWRTVFTLFSFTCFGLGALLLGTVVFPLIHLANRNSDTAQRACRKCIHYSFRLFVAMMKVTGVLDYEIVGRRQPAPGQLIVANHPSLIDVIFVVAQVPDAYCVVKDDLGRNLFTRFIVKATGYVTFRRPDLAISRCVELLESGSNAVMFPEGTRTVPGQPLTFKHGTSRVICKALCPVVPVYLRISPPTLAKGESWSKVPPTRVQYLMEFGETVAAQALMEENRSERHNTRVCAQRLQSLFEAKLGKDSHYGKPAEGHQGPDREYSGARGYRAFQHRGR
jgi:1-acyl-sn-glycerol-3-phosphate acyltransferase